MIRVNLGSEVKPGVWAYSVEGFAVEGRSRQPLLDACRQIKRMGGTTALLVGLFRKERCDMSCSVEIGAGLTVDEAGPRFARWKPDSRVFS